jgi:hypothetical protein
MTSWRFRFNCTRRQSTSEPSKSGTPISGYQIKAARYFDIKTILAQLIPYQIHYPLRRFYKSGQKLGINNDSIIDHMTVWGFIRVQGHGGCLKSWDIQPFWFGWRTAGMGKAGLFCGKIENETMLWEFWDRNSNQNCSKQGANFRKYEHQRSGDRRAIRRSFSGRNPEA